MSIVNALFLSLTAGIATSLPAIFREFGGHPKDMPLLVDIKTFWGHRLTKGEVFWFGLMINLLTAALFGLLYELLSIKEIVGYTFTGLMLYAPFFWIFIGGVIFPIVGLGFFGQKEGKWVWLELLVVHLLLALLIWLQVTIWPVLIP